MSTVTVRTNNVPRPVIYGYDLTAKERAEFDYLIWSEEEGQEEMSEGAARAFFRYKGSVYDLGDCMAVEESNTLCAGWHGYYGESYFSAVVVKYVNNFEDVIVGQVFC